MPTNQSNFVIYDIETSGTDPTKGHEIVQFAACVCRYQDYEDHSIKPIEILIKPQTPEKADPKALEVIGMDLWERACKDGMHPKVAFKKIHTYFKDANFTNSVRTSPIRVGYNICGFDNPFLEYHMKHYKLINQKQWDIPWNWSSIDLGQSMFEIFGRDDLPNRKLDTFAKMMGVERKSDKHDGVEDVLITKEIFVRYMKFMQIMRTKLKIKNA